MVNAAEAQELLNQLNSEIKCSGSVVGSLELELVRFNKVNKSVLALAKECIALMPYDFPGGRAVTWERCSIRQWLNSEFYENLPSTVKKRVLEAELETKDNCSVPGGKNTFDRLFLLSIEDYNELPEPMRAACFSGKPCWWWLRSPGYSATDVANVMPNGALDGGLKGHGFYSHCNCGGIRPAMFIKLN